MSIPSFGNIIKLIKLQCTGSWKWHSCGAEIIAFEEDASCERDETLVSSPSLSPQSLFHPSIPIPCGSLPHNHPGTFRYPACNMPSTQPPAASSPSTSTQARSQHGRRPRQPHGCDHTCENCRYLVLPVPFTRNAEILLLVPSDPL